MRRILTFLLTITIVYALSGCGAVKPYIDREHANWQQGTPPDSSTLLHTVYLIGDAGAPAESHQEPSLKLLESFLRNSATVDTGYYGRGEDMVIFLGDNIYHDGLPAPDESDRAEGERKIIAQMDVVKNFRGKKIFIPGNHDWNNSKRGGLATVNRQEQFVENYLGGNVFMPSNGCPGPIDVIVSSDLVVLLIDTEWWLHRYEKPYAPENGCQVGTELDFMVRLADLLERYKGNNILICQHHPIASNGNHGGHYSLKDHIFPLTLVREKLYIPFPVIGSIYPLGRMYGTSRQDIAHPLYQQLIDGMISIISEHDNVILAAGHEHNLQHWQINNFTQIVSGSGCKDKYLIKGNEATFAYDHKGFAIVKYYKNGEVWVEYWIPVEDGSTGKMVFRTPAYARKPEHMQRREPLPAENYTDSVITIAAGEEYAGPGATNFFLGEHYRDVWEVPVQMPYLDMTTFAGGLKPLQMGGGKQTISLRLLGDDGNQYTLRSVNKNPDAALPETFRRTFAEEILQDQISSAHPYGALTIPDMAEPLGILHARPQLVYVPFTPQLGNYLPEFGGMVATIEIRPEDDMGCLRGLGCLEKVISSRTLFTKLKEDNDNKVDERLFLKSRLFDMLVGDWDRHEDQWRWAEKPNENGKGATFLPIPRDRDQVYVKLDGIIPRLGSAKWAVRHLSHFGNNYGDIVGLNISATALDRRLLNQAPRELWRELSDTIRTFLTDSIIEFAVRQMPPEAFEVSGKEIISKLKSRRDQILKAAMEYYEVLAERVDVVGSDKHEYVLVERLNDEETRVTMFKKYKQGEIVMPVYQRTFFRGETEEVNIFTLGGMDSIVLRGDVRKGILIRVISGTGADYVIDSSRVRGLRNYTVIYEEPVNDSLITEGRSTRLELTDEPFMHTFDRNEFNYDFLGPRLYIEYNVDDGLYLGAGILNRLNGFKKDPYKAEQFLRANYAFRTGAYNFRYNGDFYSFFTHRVDLAIDAHILGPSYVMNYFGEGNFSQFTRDIDYYRLRLTNLDFSAMINKRFTDFFMMGIGPLYQDFTVMETPGRFISSDDFPYPGDLDGPDRFAGGRFNLEIDFRDDDYSPTRGVRIEQITDVNAELSGDDLFARLQGSLRFYLTPNLPFRMTLATRLGAAGNIGQYPFYQANFLGGFTNLRGYHRTRFAGHSIFYHNTDLRWRTFNFRNYLFSGTGGLIGFFDYGSVWSDKHTLPGWHISGGPGAWINFYNYFLVSSYVGFSDEGRYLNVNFGFFF